MPRSRPLLALTVGGWLLAVTAAAYLFGRPLTGFALAAFLALTWMLFAMYPSPVVKTSPAAPAPVRPVADVRRVRRLAAQFRALRDAVAALPDAVVLLDDACRILWLNPAAGTLLGLTRPEHLYTDLCQQLGDSAIGPWLRTGGDAPLDDVPAPHDAQVRLALSLIPVGARQRLLLARDISTRARLEQMRRDFVANVSHELRTPLTVIHGYLELLDPEDVPQLAGVLGDMRGQSKRMAQIVEDLLTLSRLETQSGFSEEPVAMAPLLATLRREAEVLSQGRHRVILENESEADLLGSLKDLHSAFSNLVSNAVRYTPSGGSIRIRWERLADGRGAFSVIDTGYGIPAHHISRLTERFYRVSSSRSRELGGTGLGLSIVKHALGMHQAQIQISSEPGQGSTFTALFPGERLLPARAADPGVQP
ncbi:MAG: phosphate regulon sensor histidine kinase PhoR [Metallibacterium scheffleri]|jgi:two-component system phosphate regulon sensor histidine kinase PhoR|nr:phosphate regulon sensor histidine kinase PhoR [Metallibacterium scheffleri]